MCIPIHSVNCPYLSGLDIPYWDFSQNQKEEKKSQRNQKRRIQTQLITRIGKPIHMIFFSIQKNPTAGVKRRGLHTIRK